MENYDLRKDKLFKKIINNKDVAPATVTTYHDSVKQFCIANNKPLEQIVKEMKDGEYGEIIGNKIKPYNPEDSYTKECFDTFRDYLEEKQVKTSTIRQRIFDVRSVLRETNVILPKAPHFKEKREKLILLRRKDIAYVMSICDVHTQAFLAYAASVGFRVKDVLQLTIGDFMYATRRYHNCTSVEEFLEKAPQNMVGYWEIIPNKTKRFSLECKVCNTPESSNLLLKSLRLRAKSIENKNKRTGRNEKLEFDDALFGSRNKYYKKAPNPKSFTILLNTKNKKLQEHLKRELKQQLENEVISLIEYRKKLEELPNIHPHALRHYFISVLNAYCENKTIALQMEAHASDVKSHKHYIGQSEELYDEDMIREHYEKLIPYLTFNRTIDVKEYLKFKENERLLKEYQEKEKEWENQQKEISIKYNELSEKLEKIISK